MGQPHPIRRRPLRAARARRAVAWTGLCLAALAWSAASAADDELENVLGNIGSAQAVGDQEAGEEAPAPAPAGQGIVRGQVFDGEAGTALRGVTVILVWPDPGGGREPRQEVQVTGFDGSYEFRGVPPGRYKLTFVKSGYRSSTMTDYAVQAGQVNRADFPMPPLPTETSEGVLQLDEFVVEASTVEEMMSSLELRLDSDQLLNTFSAEEFSRFAAGDVAEALKRVAGVNVVEGQFAIIRGLEDRYSSTLYNGAPVPSPDPDSQSVQLDLFPSDVVSNLSIAKTFGPDLPGNSAGGSIDIITHDYPEGFEIKVAGGTGFNDNAVDRFLRFNKGSPTGKEVGEDHVIESDYGVSVGGRRDFFERDFRAKGVFSHEIDYETAEGWQQGREPRLAWLPGEIPPPFTPTVGSGDLSLGRLSLTDGRFDLTESERSDQWTGYGAFGFDIDEAGNHKIDASAFYTKKENETVQAKENGFLPNYDYGIPTQLDDGGLGEVNSRIFLGSSTVGSWIAQSVRQIREEPASRGPLFFTNFGESRSFERRRDLLVTQINGDHTIEQVEGLHFSWAMNHATTKQKEDSRGIRIFFEPDDVLQAVPEVFPVKLDVLGPGRFAAPAVTLNKNDIKEKQDFARVDGEYERDLLDMLSVRIGTGGWYENSNRSVDSTFLESPTVSPLECAQTGNCTGAGGQFAILGDSVFDLGQNVFDSLSKDEDGTLNGLRNTTNDAKREIWAWNGDLKLTLWDQLDLLGGVRIEDIKITSKNKPFTGEDRFMAPDTFPSRYLFFDRLDNPSRGEVLSPPPPGTVFNDEIINIEVPVDPQTGFVDLFTRGQIKGLVNGEIDKTKYLPAASIAWRPIEGLSVRGAYSQTVARPSFREIGYYVSLEPGSEDRVVGNPQLQLSDVESWDARVEYSWGAFGDLFAVSAFQKTIKDPIEAIVVRDPLNREFSSTALFRTFFNNPNEATLWGIELEFRKSLDFFGVDFLNYLSFGGNFTYIDAKVERTEAERQRAEAFFGTLQGDREKFSNLSKTRRLFGQPEYIANADVTFDHPEWGTKVTLAFFAISDVLDAAGSATLNAENKVVAFTLDRYIDAFNQLDLIMSQTIPMPRELGEWTLKFSAKNLTNSTRKIVYDPQQTTSTITERSLKVGRDFSFGISYTYSF